MIFAPTSDIHCISLTDALVRQPRFGCTQLPRCPSADRHDLSVAYYRIWRRAEEAVNPAVFCALLASVPFATCADADAAAPVPPDSSSSLICPRRNLCICSATSGFVSVCWRPCARRGEEASEEVSFRVEWPQRVAWRITSRRVALRYDASRSHTHQP